jgi:RNA polymerase sigma-70 factor (ECF subfamily)
MESRASFEDLLAAYQDKVFRLACSLLGNDAQAEDVTQDVFIRVWKALPGYRGEASLSTWIYAIARNACLTALKAASARPTVALDDAAVRPRLLGRLERPGDLDIPALLGSLPEKYRQVIILFYLEDKSYEEVALLLDLPMGTVKTYLHRARKELIAAVARAKTVQGAR